jgi:hypothetical protein
LRKELPDNWLNLVMRFIAISAAGRLVHNAKIAQIWQQKKKEIPITNVVVQLIILWMIYKDSSIGAKVK